MNLLPAFVGAPELNKVYHCDLLTLCNALPEKSVDMILADLPYGTTACSWDEIIPFEPMWQAFKRVIKPRGAIVLTASQPFTSKLVCSNLEMLHEELIWDKVASTGYLDASRRHLKQHENILVFCTDALNYYPQMAKGRPYVHKGRSSNFAGYSAAAPTPTISNGERYPKSIVIYSASTAAYERLHPTQKPVALFEYLIETYTRQGDIVLDPCVGSGTTAIAAYKTGRNFICGDITEDYVKSARERLDKARLDKPIPVTSGVFQRTIFEIAGD